MLRVIREIKPSWIVAENVPGILTIESGLVFERVCSEMEAEGYEVQPVIIPACATGAPHRRDRVWFIAHNDNLRRNRNSEFEEIDNRRIQERVEQRYEPDSQTIITSNTQSERLRKEGEHIQRSQERTSGADTDDNKLNGNNAGFCSGEISQQQEAKIFGGVDPNPNDEGLEEWQGANTERERQNCRDEPTRTIGSPWDEHWFEAATRLCIVDDGLSSRLSGITLSKWRTESLKAAGNAVQPQVVFEIFKAIEAAAGINKKLF